MSEGGVVKNTAVGYLTSHEDAETINMTYCLPFKTWIDSNIDDLENGVLLASSYIDQNGSCYQVGHCNDNINGMNLTEILDIENLP